MANIFYSSEVLKNLGQFPEGIADHNLYNEFSKLYDAIHVLADLNSFEISFEDMTTDNLAEGSANLYFTDQRAIDAISGAGYLTSETDPVFGAHVAASITQEDIDTWNAGGSGVTEQSAEALLEYTAPDISATYVEAEAQAVADQLQVACATIDSLIAKLTEAGILAASSAGVEARYWRIYITANNGGANHTIAELEYWNGSEQHDTFTDRVTAASANSEANSSNEAQHAFDNDSSTKWTTANSSVPAWLKYDFGVAVNITKIIMMGQFATGSQAAFAPKDFEIQYSDDDITYKTARIVEGETGWGGAEEREFALSESQYFLAVMGDAPIAYWRLGEATTADALFDERRNHDGTWNSGTLGATSLIAGDNTAYEPGGTGYGSIPHHADLALAFPFTIELWFKDVGTSNVVMFEKNGNSGFSMQRNSSSPYKYILNLGGTGASAISTNTGFNDGQPHHIAWVIRSTAGDSQVYVDGVDVTESAAHGTPSVASGDVYIGSRAGSVGYDGALDEIAVYDYALTEAQIIAHYEAGVISE